MAASAVFPLEAPWGASDNGHVPAHVGEERELGQERHRDLADGTLPVFGDDHLGESLGFDPLR